MSEETEDYEYYKPLNRDLQGRFIAADIDNVEQFLQLCQTDDFKNSMYYIEIMHYLNKLINDPDRIFALLTKKKDS
ncbi:hypothetical protein [Brackiella oedipodis]|uniref:hypothetical protein n=1 Tax=Brackiella oedipodis TaxID=124225 RepID=UPI000490C862|nr:hypothetical protein [Brackiella oedipodis]